MKSITVNSYFSGAGLMDIGLKSFLKTLVLYAVLAASAVTLYILL